MAEKICYQQTPVGITEPVLILFMVVCLFANISMFVKDITALDLRTEPSIHLRYFYSRVPVCYRVKTGRVEKRAPPCRNMPLVNIQQATSFQPITNHVLMEHH